MNHQHLNIRFTFDGEKNNSFSFLDVKICKENNKFTISVFRKPIFSGIVNTLIFRCFKICPSYEKLHYEIVYLKGIFKRNIYPHDFVDPCIKRFFDKLYIPPKKLSDG